MTRHYNSKHDDDAWRGWFGRWHAGETALALIREARVSMDTWNANARRLGMQIRDLPPDHPKRRAPAFGERPPEYRHRNSLLTEGQWAALFAKRAAGAPDRVLSLEYGVHPATICTQAKKRGLRREDLEMGAKGPSAAPARRAEETIETPSLSPSHPLADGEHPPRGGEGEAPVREPAPLHHPSPAATDGPPPPLGEELKGIALAGLGVSIAPEDWVETQASFDRAVQRAGLVGNLARVVALCDAKLSVKKAMFGAGAAAPPPPPSAVPLPHEGEETFAPSAPPIELRAAQRAPEGNWATWLFLGGRGAGKTLAGAMWLADMAERVGPGGRLALIGPTLHDVREVMIEGVSGLCSLPRWAGGARPVFEISRRRLVFPNGAVAQVFSAEDPDSLRGPQFSAAWADEFCTWRNASETLALLRMGLRLALPTARGADAPGATARLAEPRCLSADAVPERAEQPEAQAASDRVASVSPPLLCITTTPRPTAALRALRAEASCVETHAGTADNADHLSPGFLAGLEALYGGTRRAAQEIEGKVVELDGALFTAEMLARARVEGRGSRGEGDGGAVGDAPRPSTPDPRPRYDRVIVAIDPTTTAGGNACGIIVAGRIGDRAEVLADRSKAGLSPGGWARRTMAAAAEFGATRIVAEVNQGGEMVKAVLQAEGCTVRVREVRATKGKRVRAEPVAALYEQGRVTHRGDFAALEEELMAFGGEEEAACDLDRADALVWAITDLLIDKAGTATPPRVFAFDWAPTRIGLSNRAW